MVVEKRRIDPERIKKLCVDEGYYSNSTLDFLPNSLAKSGVNFDDVSPTGLFIIAKFIWLNTDFPSLFEPNELVDEQIKSIMSRLYLICEPIYEEVVI